MTTEENTSGNAGLAKRLLDGPRGLRVGTAFAPFQDLIAKVTGSTRAFEVLNILSQPISPAIEQGLDTNAMVTKIIPVPETEGQIPTSQSPVAQDVTFKIPA